MLATSERLPKFARGLFQVLSLAKSFGIGILIQSHMQKASVNMYFLQTDNFAICATYALH